MKMNWLNIFGSVVDVAKNIAGATPVGAALHIVSAVVDSADNGVSNESVVTTIETMAKSSWNDLTPEKVARMKAILNED